MSLRRRFALVLASFAVALAATFGYLAWRISSDALEAEMDRRLVALPRALVASGAFEAEVAMTFRPGFEPAAEASFLGPYRARLDSLPVDDAFIFDAVGYTNLVAADPRISVGDTLTEIRPHARTVNRALAVGEATTGAFPGPEGRMYKYGFVRMSEDEPAVLAVLIPADFFEPLADLRRVLVWGTVIALAVAIGIAGLLAANIARPLERLARVALRIQRGRMDRPVELERADEIGRLSRAMERMRRGILERDEQLRLMLAQVAHEIRNPLGGLELFASAAAESRDPDERMRLLGRVRSEVESLNRIIDDFLIYARPLQTREETTDLRAPVREAAELAEAEIRSQGRQLEVRLPDRPLEAVVDADRVKRAVLNLLRNAAQAASSRVLLRAGMEETEVAILVTDDGPGVPEEARERVFEPFITDKERGAGLGLAIVRKVVEGQGGRVEVGAATEEGFGNGAEFRIYFVGLQEPPPESRTPRD